MAKTPYYADFYVTCASVIPVIFLAVVLAARAYESWLAGLPKKALGLRRVLLFAAYASVIVGGVGEFGALWELRWRQNTVKWNWVVFWTTLVLLVVVLFGSVIGALNAAFGKLRLTADQRKERDQRLSDIGDLVADIATQAASATSNEGFPLADQVKLKKALVGIDPPMRKCDAAAAATTVETARAAASKASEEVDRHLRSLRAQT
jgi:hypothetical protein